MEANNSYWESVAAKYTQADESDIIERIKQCQFVIDKLEKDELWQIILKDIDVWTKNLDNNWQDIQDEKQLNTTRVLKTACVHLQNLKSGYVADWKIASEELERRNNTDVIERDLDNG